MTVLERIMDDYPDDEFMKVNGFDDAIVGYDGANSRLVYDTKKVIDALVQQGMDEEEAIEYFDFNIAGSHFGEGTPIFITTYA